MNLLNSINNLLKIVNDFTIRVFSFLTATITQLGIDLVGESAGDAFGYTSSINNNGNIIAIGAPWKTINGQSNVGQVKIYSWDGSTWTQLGASINGAAAGENIGALVCLNDNGDRVIVGSQTKIKAYSWNGLSWTQLGQTINVSASTPYNSISTNELGDRIVMGAPYADTANGTDSGVVHTYYFNNSTSTWVYLSGIAGPAASELFGYSVSMNAVGDKIVVGGTGALSMNNGRVRTYYWNGSAWNLTGLISGSQSLENFGNSVCMNKVGDKIIVGAFNNYYGGNPGGIPGSGTVRVYSWNGSAWIQIGSNLYGQMSTGENFGTSVSINDDGDVIAISAPYAASQKGRVKVYYFDGNAWIQSGTDIDGKSTTEKMGFTRQSLSLNSTGKIFIISGYSTNSNTGVARAYSLT